MLRDVLYGLVVAAVIGVLFALVMYFRPVNWNPGDDARDPLVLVGIMLSATGFFVEFVASRLDRRLRQDMSKIDERNRLFEEASRARAHRLNAYAIARRDSIRAPDTAVRDPESPR